MNALVLAFSPRYVAFTLSVLLASAAAVGALTAPGWGFALGVAFLLFAGLALLGVRDMLQPHHSILRMYPISAHLRFLFEDIRPELRQYFFESDKDGLPFSRDERSVVYQRAKMQLDKRPFGSQLDVYAEGYEYLRHSLAPKPMDPKHFRIPVGGPDCTQPYDISVLNISAMSFGALSANAIRALNKGARKGGFAHDTGEGGISPYHREAGGDLIWEIGSGHFGCRGNDGTFSPERFRGLSTDPQIKMIEIKLSQGAKPGHGGVLPGAKVSAEIAATRGVEMGKDCISPSHHTAFSTPLQLMEFIAKLRDLSGGKPIGFKLCLGHPWEFLAVCKAMLATGIYPDFIVVDGKEGGTGAAPTEFMDRLGMPMRDGLTFVHNTLVGVAARERIRIGASGKITNAFDMARAMALGADWCNSARGFMFALGCIQSLSCHSDRCPTGVTTQDPTRARALHVPDKAERVYNFHRATLHALSEITAAAGLDHPNEFHPEHFCRRVTERDTMTFAELYPPLMKGEILDGARDERLRAAWEMAKPESFAVRI